MITVTLKFLNVITTHDFNSLTEALAFARDKEIGTLFQIREGQVLLAKGKIEDYKENYRG